MDHLPYEIWYKSASPRIRTGCHARCLTEEEAKAELLRCREFFAKFHPDAKVVCGVVINKGAQEKLAQMAPKDPLEGVMAVEEATLEGRGLLIETLVEKHGIDAGAADRLVRKHRKIAVNCLKGGISLKALAAGAQAMLDAENADKDIATELELLREENARLKAQKEKESECLLEAAAV